MYMDKSDFSEGTKIVSIITVRAITN